MAMLVITRWYNYLLTFYNYHPGGTPFVMLFFGGCFCRKRMKNLPRYKLPSATLIETFGCYVHCVAQEIHDFHARWNDLNELLDFCLLVNYGSLLQIVGMTLFSFEYNYTVFPDRIDRSGFQDVSLMIGIITMCHCN